MHALACRLLSFLCFIVIADKEKCMYLMIDNFDSFVYNLKAYFEEMGRCVTVKRCDRISLHDVEDLEPEGIILSPGPGRPWEAKMCGCCEHV